MTVIEGAEPVLPRDERGTVVTVGTFDGVHRGHREVLEEIVRRAEGTGRRSVLVTFDPHPLRIVRPEAAPPLLTTLKEKKALLAETGLEYAIFLAFTRELQQYPARRFVEEILLGRLDMRELVIGYDHGFGRGREGDVETLRELGAEFGFAVDVVGPVGDESPVSSTKIRKALLAGDVRGATEGLGRPYTLSGTVVHGAKRGRELGFPTANIAVSDAEKLIPAAGVYAAYGIVSDERIPALLHVGPRPTFAGAPSTIELYLIDWSGEIYGNDIAVEVIEFIRGIEKFDSVDELVNAMKEDEVVGRRILRGGFPTGLQDQRDR